MLYESRSVRRLKQKKGEYRMLKKVAAALLGVVLAASVFLWPQVSAALQGLLWPDAAAEAGAMLPEESDMLTVTGTQDETEQDEIEEQAAEEPEEAAQLASAPVGDEYFDDALFVGDSLTYGLQHYQIIPGASFVSSTGINLEGIRTENLVIAADGTIGTMMQAIAKQKTPGKIYVMMGTNGINWQVKEDMLTNYTRLLDHIMDCHPQVPVYVQSIPPATAAAIAVQPGFTVERVRSYNEGLRELAAAKGAHFIDVYAVLADEQGLLPEEASISDGIHFNVESYYRWYEYLKANAVITE